MATTWTDEQLDAINLEGNNIIVSAGAGSGKTAVLTERVLRKVKQNIHVDELLIITFTNAAAKEMKDRIRSKLREASLVDEVNLIDNAYITTFDSFSLSIVKKYHTYLNISKNIGITDISLLNIKENEIIDEIFNDYYSKDNLFFSNLIKNFCYKDDKELKKLIIKLNHKLDLIYKKEEYLDNYISINFNDEKINEDIDKYFLEIKKIINLVSEMTHELSLYMDGTYIEKVNNYLLKLYNAECYNDLVNSLDDRFPTLPKNTDENAKELKARITFTLKEIKQLIIYKNTDEIKNEIFSTKDNITMIIELVKLLNSQFNLYKINNNMYDFSDISRMAIKLVEENSDIRDELKNRFQEIMIDEYQDTNDIGEYFISLISNNNVYMVGDIKQSIYRFRNANPYIFKSKYDNYAHGNNGIKIDLLKNFRSRQEVLNNINLIFDNLMDDDIGGANYKESHRMIFGNKSYIEKGNTLQKYDFSILEYEEDKEFSNNEKEMFIIGRDIIDKIKNSYQIFDMKKQMLRKVNYSDFVILIDRATDFDNYKKVFEYLHIPLTLYKDEDLKNDRDILVIRNLLKLIRCVDQEKYTEEFKYSFMSIGRSFLFEKSDEELFEYFYNDNFKSSDIYLKLIDAYNYYYDMSPKMFFLKLLDIFNYEESLLKINNIKTGRIRIEYFYNLLDNFEDVGKDIEDFIDYFDNIFLDDSKVTFSLNSSNNNSVKIMTIHKSKGLEFPICYFSGFSREFSFRELNDNILYSDKYGIIVPYFNEYSKPTIYKTLLKLDNRIEEISEKIRLLYVALTRAKENMIIVIPKIDSTKLIYSKNKIKSFLDMIKLIYFDIDGYLLDINYECSNEYLINKNNKIYKPISVEKFVVNEIDSSYIELNEGKFSKGENKKLSIEEIDKMKYGTKIHEVLEMIDFTNPDYSKLDSFVKNKVKIFIESDIIRNNLSSKFYKEYEFCSLEDNNLSHGIIDLMIENDNEIIIIDYKLKNTSDLAYIKQLNGYKSIIEKRSNKKISLYLYSIIEEKFFKIDM